MPDKKERERARREEKSGEEKKFEKV